MLCHRCRGLLVYERLSEVREQAGDMCIAVRCLNCGCIEDSVIRFNRLHPAATTRPIARRTPRLRPPRISILTASPTPPGNQLLRAKPAAQAKA